MTLEEIGEALRKKAAELGDDGKSYCYVISFVKETGVKEDGAKEAKIFSVIGGACEPEMAMMLANEMLALAKVAHAKAVGDEVNSKRDFKEHEEAGYVVNPIISNLRH